MKFKLNDKVKMRTDKRFWDLCSIFSLFLPKLYFRYGLPALLVLQLALAGWLYWKFK